MENTEKKLIFFFILLIIISCGSNQKSEIKKTNSSAKNYSKSKAKDTLKCKNDPSLYTEVTKNLLYKDSNSNIYLRRKQNNSPSPLGGELTKCQKLTYAFIDYVGTLNDSIGFIKDIVNVHSFERIDNSDLYFTDKANVYTYRYIPVGYPAFYQIDINPKYNKVINSSYIKDELKVYWNGINIENVDCESFMSSTFKTKNGKELILVHDKNHIYFNNKPYTLERLDKTLLRTSVIDSLKNIFFKE